MSLIPQFYTLPTRLKPKLLEASCPKEVITKHSFLFIFKRERLAYVDRLRGFLGEFGHEKRAFEYSGAAFLQLELLLEGNGFDLYRYENQPASDQFRNGSSTFGSIFEHEEARSTLTKLESYQFSREAIENFFQEENVYTEEEIKDGVEATQAAKAALQNWLETVQNGEIGLLTL